jgi:hypothetical protein
MAPQPQQPQFSKGQHVRWGERVVMIFDISIDGQDALVLVRGRSDDEAALQEAPLSALRPLLRSQTVMK